MAEEGGGGVTSHLRKETPESDGIKIRTAALEDLISEQENYLALLRMRRERLDRDLVLARRMQR